MELLLTTVTEVDITEITRQLGRFPRGVAAVAARCICTKPLVVATSPRLEDGSPFPTTFYLTHPHLIAAVSRLEAAGIMKVMSEDVAVDSQLHTSYVKAHQYYLKARGHVGAYAGIGHVPEIENISVGGMPERVKCLHALVGHSLAAGAGINPIGDKVLDLLRDDWNPRQCFCKKEKVHE